MSRQVAAAIAMLVVPGCSGQGRTVRTGQSDDVAARIDALGDDALDEIVGLSIAVARRDETIIARAFGAADRERGSPVTAATPFRIASTTKQFVAYAILQLVEDGVLALDENIAVHLPNFPLDGRRVTLRQLLSHTSGVAEHVGDPETDAVFARHADGVIPLDVTISTFAGRPFDFEPGTRWSYSNSGYVLLVAVIEAVTGKDYGAFLRERIFEPLDLDHTDECDVAAPPAGLAVGYTRGDDGLVAVPPHIPGSTAGGGFLCATAADLAAWQVALHRSRLGTLMSVATTLNDGTVVPYGLAMSIADLEGHPMMGHGGIDAGFRASVRYFPDDEVTVIVLANTDDDRAFEVADQVARISLDLPESSQIGVPLDEAAGRAAAGTYEISRGWQWTFTFVDGALEAQSGGSDPLRLAYQGEGVYRVPSRPSYRFAFAADGKADSVLVDQFGMRFLGLRALATLSP